MQDPLNVLRRTWGYQSFRPYQEEVVRSVVAGTDTLALLPTGGGKSICFQVPGLVRGGLCLVVSPLIALMHDQVQRLRQAGVSAVAVTSAMSYNEMDVALDNAAAGRTAFLYLSPERLSTELFLARSPRLPVTLIAVDEAHCISQWGYDFRPAYMRIPELRTQHPQAPVIALTATATSPVAQDIMGRLGFRNGHLVQGDFRRPEITWWHTPAEDRNGRLLRIAEKISGTGIVYLRDRKGTIRTASMLQQHGISAAAYHAGMDHGERARIQAEWTSGAIRYVAATNAFGMGIDKPDVRSVVHLAPPPDLESYYQEAGRAGRDGQPSFAFLLAHPGDERGLRERFAQSFPEPADLRKVYQAFVDQHRIATGSGLGETYDVDIAYLAQRCGLDAGTVHATLRTLELDGQLALSEGLRSPSRVFIIAPPATIYRMRTDDPRRGPLLDTLLRLHGGLYEEAAQVEETRLAKQTGWTVDRTVSTLRELHELRTIHYRPRRDLPGATFLVPRPDVAQWRPDPEAYALRKKRAAERLEAMLQYTYRPNDCRERMLLTYFGQEVGAACGRCDVCQRRTRAYQPPDGSSSAPPEQHRWEVAEGLHPTDPA